MGMPPFGPPGPPFGPGDGPFGRHGFGRGMRARKGDVRAAILDLFAEEEGRGWNGYQLIQEIPARTDGAWRPSAGSVYPALQQLEDEGLITPQGTGRRRVYTLTDKGRGYVEAHADELRSSWDAAAGMTDDDAIEFRNLIRQVMMAVMEVRRARLDRAGRPGASGARAGPQVALPDPGRGRARHRRADGRRPARSAVDGHRDGHVDGHRAAGHAGGRRVNRGLPDGAGGPGRQEGRPGGG